LPWLITSYPPTLSQLISKSLFRVTGNLYALNTFVSMNDLEMYSKITLRKKEILQLVNNGATDQEIALNLNISINTVKTHLKEIYKILDAKNRTQACLIYNNLKNTITS